MLSDPIAALATAPGRGALALVRLSGAGAFAVAARVVPGFRPEPPRRARWTTFLGADGLPIDRGVCVAYVAPHSYTGEDAVEFTCHGGAVAAPQLLAALVAAGARPAAPGEFTRRAVLNGRMDLLQAEAVADLVDATAPAQARAALHQVEGGLSRRIEGLRTQLLDLLAAVGYLIDFPEEDDGPVAPDTILSQVAAVHSAVGALLATAPSGERLRTGALVVLAGAPNSGKSSLFNAMLGAERALVTPLPGTTRDAIEAETEFEGWPIRLADTAGLRDADEPIERLGIEVSQRYLEHADLVLLCAEAGRPLTAAERRLETERPTVLVRTKADLVAAGTAEVEGLVVSVVSGEGLASLRAVVAARLFGPGGRFPVPDLGEVVLRARHRSGLEEAASALAAARRQFVVGGDAALGAHELQRALVALDALVGVVDPDEVLGRIFSRFCVGK